jgi:CDP-diacylglycerol--serine O-phosphatidyltransferase
MVLVAALMISRLRTLSMKTVRVPAEFIAPLLVLVGLAAAAIITVPFLALALTVVLYLLHLPYAVYRYRWLARHPEAWYVAARQRRAAVRALRNSRSLGIRPPLRRRVAGAARAKAAALNTRRRREDSLSPNGSANGRASGPDTRGEIYGLLGADGAEGAAGRPGVEGAAGRHGAGGISIPGRNGRRLGLRKIRRDR